MEKVCPTCQTEYGEDVDFCPHDGMKLRRRRGDDAEDPMIGRVLEGRWVIESKIGQGGMGAVYQGHQQSVDRKVAIKTLRASLADTDDFVDRFFREARVATTINHPHCVTIHDFGQAEDETLYLAMEFLEGQDLTSRIRQGDLTVEESLRISIQIASALSAAHDANIVHRDLKPDNIFLLDISDGSTFVKVLDFGIAKVLGADTQMTKTGQVFGTPDYMSPEQCQGQKIDGRSDLYSLGCILYELLGGRPPFQGETPMAILMAHVANDVPPLSSLDGVMDGVDPRVEEEVMALLSKDPDGRPATASEAKNRLEALLSSLNTTTTSAAVAEAANTAPQTRRPTPLAATEPANAVGDSMTTAQIQQQVGYGSGKRILLAVLVLFVVVAVVGGGAALAYFVFAGDEDTGGETPVVAETDDEDQLEEKEADRRLAKDDSEEQGDRQEEDAEDEALAEGDDEDETDEGEIDEDQDQRAEARDSDRQTTSSASGSDSETTTQPRTVTRPDPTPQPRPRPRPSSPDPPEEEDEDDDPLDFFGDD